MKIKKLIVWIVILGALIVLGTSVRNCLLADPVPYGEPTAAPTGAAWINLLDAEHAGDWDNTSDDADIFEIADGQLHIFGHYPLRYVTYEAERFGDFDLHLEFRLESGANSGVFLRTSPDDPVYRGFEVQVLDDHGDPPDKNGSGAIYDVTTPMYNMARPAGSWNSYDITVDGPEVLVRMNGWLVVHTDLSKMTMPIGKFETPLAELPLQGYLALQDHGGEIWYRNIFIRPR